MSLKGAEIKSSLDELLSPNPNLQNTSSIEALDYLNIKNNFHNKLISSIKINMAKEISDLRQDENENNLNPIHEKIKYKSKLKLENLNKIINLEMFNNIPSNKSLELLSNFQQRTNNMLLNKNKKIEEKENENLNNNINQNDDDRANINSFLDRKNKIKNNFNLNKSQDNISYGGGSYMDI